MTFSLVELLKGESERLLDVAKCAVEIAIEQDEGAAISFLETSADNGKSNVEKMHFANI